MKGIDIVDIFCQSESHLPNPPRVQNGNEKQYNPRLPCVLHTDTISCKMP